MFKIGDKLKHVTFPDLRYEIRSGSWDDYEDQIVWVVYSYYSLRSHTITDSKLRKHMSEDGSSSDGISLVFDNDISISPSHKPLKRHRLCTNKVSI